jgi:hypothetical protein
MGIQGEDIKASGVVAGNKKPPLPSPERGKVMG